MIITPNSAYRNLFDQSAGICLSCLLGFLLLTPLLPAQNIRIDNYQHLTVDDGLPYYYIMDLAEDKYGFIWVATWNGLARYDGSRFISLDRLPSDSVYLPSQNITCLLPRGDSLWIGTNRGLSIFNLQDRSYSNFILDSSYYDIPDDAEERLYIRDIYEDRDGNVWLAPMYGGFVKWDKTLQTFTSFPVLRDDHLPNAYRMPDQTSLEQIIQDVDQDSILWAASMAGLIKLNQETGKVTRILYEKMDENTRFRMNRKICLVQGKDRKVYIGGWYLGLSIYNPLDGTYTYPGYDSLQNFNMKFPREHLFSITLKSPSILYLTYSEGLYSYHIEKQELRVIKKNITRPNPAYFGIRLIDSQKRIWFGSSTGLIISDPINQQYNWYSLAHLNPTNDRLIPRGLVEDFFPGYLTISGQYSDGIYHINPSTGHSFKHEARSVMEKRPYFFSWGLSQIDENHLLISEDQNLFGYEKGDEIIRPTGLKIPALKHYLHNILVDVQKTAWIGSKNDGLFTIDLSNGKIRQYNDKVSSPRVNGQFQDSKGNIWMVMELGHLVFSRAEEKLKVFDFLKDSTRTFRTGGNYCECPNGEVWLSGYAEGLALVSSEAPEKGIIKKIRIVSDAGETVSVQRIACNRKNELWAYGANGLLHLNRDDWSFESFNSAYGFSPGGLDLFRFTKDDSLFIGARDGFYLFDPHKLRINHQLPKPYVVSVVSNQGPKNRLEDHLNKLPVILRPMENVITIDFSAINHTLAEAGQFRYMLDGVDEDWIDPGDKRSITYVYLAGGDYTFKLKAANNEGFWNPEIYQLPIHVGTPWYKTSFFWLILIGFMIAIVYTYYRDRIRQVEVKSEFEKRVADLEMSALRAQMNPHFIFNCLNSIDAYIIKNDSRKASEYLNNFSRLVRLILQNSRTSYVNLKDELEALELYIKLEQMRLRSSFEYEINLRDGLLPDNYEIPPMLIQPYVENAIWHGLNYLDAGGKVMIEIETNGDTLICTIEDNGIGRAAAAKIREAKNVKRKSMGMGITTARIEIINKLYETDNQIQIFDLYDEEGQAAGTRVILHIPV